MGGLSVKTLQSLALKGIISAQTYFQLKRLKKRKNCRPEYTRHHFAFDSFTNDECLLWFRFSREEIKSLVVSLKIPSVCIAHPRIKFTGIEGLCILLCRLSYPNRLNDIVTTFNRDATVLSRIFNWMINWMYNHYSASVKTLRQKYLTPERLSFMAEVTSLCGCAYPNVIGFIDGTFRPSCKPKYHQRDFYSGYNKVHGLKYQSITLPNGLIGRLDGGYIGRRHDAAIVHLSKVVDEMKDFLTNCDGTWYAVYGDPGYTSSKYIKVGYKNHSRLTAQQRDFNAMMSALRVTVEYGFGGIVQQFAYLDFKKNQKIYLQPLQKMYYVAAFLVNCQCCLRGGNLISEIFDCDVPTLTEYLSH